MSKLVLVIDDDPDQRKLLDRVLSGNGYRVATAPDGEAGLLAARNRRPDLILLDVMMPRLNGFQTCRRLKQDPDTAAVPVVILTTKDQAADEFWANEVGAQAFLNKPVDFKVLLDTVTRLMGSA